MATDTDNSDAIFRKMLPVARRCTVPILVGVGDTPRQRGTGTLVRIADYFLLVTASHVHRDLPDSPPPLYFANGDGSLLPLWPNDIRFTPKRFSTKKRDPFDLAFWILGRETVDALVDTTFLNRTDIDISDSLRHGTYYIFGYPSNWAKPAEDGKKVINAGGLQMLADACDEPEGDLEHYDPRYHGLFHANLRRIEATDDSDIIAPPSSYGGISGCSVWKVGALPEAADEWDANTAKVVAVETSYYWKSGLIRATSWKAIVQMLLKSYPELQRGFRLNFPT